MPWTAMQDIFYYFTGIQKAHGRHNSVLWFKWSLKYLNLREIAEEVNAKFHSIIFLAENESSFLWENGLKFFGFVLCFVDSVSCNPEWPPTHSEAKAGLELLILLGPPPKCWDYKDAPPCPAGMLFLTFILQYCLKFMQQEVFSVKHTIKMI